jgi:hypothetical protein
MVFYNNKLIYERGLDISFSLHDNNFVVTKLFLYSLAFLLESSVRKARKSNI